MKYIDAIDYQLEIGRLEESSFPTLLQSYSKSKKVIIVDENTHDNCLSYLITTFDDLAEAEVILLPAGEENKQMSIAFSVWEALTEYQVGRNDLIINLGGGMITDMGGFIASCYKRGCDFINIPTSLLAMVDASIGGKTGINLNQFKNQIGVFSNPKSVFIDTSFLQTLPLEELESGYAEMLKHGLISSKDLFFEILEQLEHPTELSEALLLKSIEVKNKIVKQDPLENGWRKVLNFGHTIGHAIEGHFMGTLNIPHGHAVAIGMVMEAFLSVKHGKLSVADYEEIEPAILTHYKMPNLSDEDIQGMIALLSNDKKNSEGRINCCLLTKIGDCTIDNYLPESYFMEMFMHFKNLQINLN
ncbi:MAG TPA: 3-dehydroquinate synthase [Crocinitomicaceae bacterium]|nr:3-dehydroquinate synthase [Crocinitomicaceae bacterium]